MYRGLAKDIEKKVTEYQNHDPFSYEVDTWADLTSNVKPNGTRG